MKQRIIIGALMVIAVMLSIALADNGIPDRVAAFRTTAHTPIVGFSGTGSTNSWGKTHLQSIIQNVEDSGMHIQISDSQKDQMNQIKAIRAFIEQKVDVIAFIPVQETGWEGILKEAKKAGIPVVVVDRDIKIEDESLIAARIGSDNNLEGREAFGWVDSYINSNGIKPRSGSKFNVAIIQGDMGSSVANQRQAGFAAAMEESANANLYTIKRSMFGDFSRDKGYTVMKSILNTDRDSVDVVFAHSDEMALGAVKAIEESGLQPGRDILIVSIDGIKAAFEAMALGNLNCVVENNPKQGEIFVQIVKDILAKHPVPRTTYMEAKVFTQKDAAQLIPERSY